MGAVIVTFLYIFQRTHIHTYIFNKNKDFFLRKKKDSPEGEEFVSGHMEH